MQPSCTTGSSHSHGSPPPVGSLSDVAVVPVDDPPALPDGAVSSPQAASASKKKQTNDRMPDARAMRVPRPEPHFPERSCVSRWAMC